MMKSTSTGKFPPATELSVFSAVMNSQVAAHRMFSDVERLRDALFGEAVRTEAGSSDVAQEGAMNRLVEEAQILERRAMIASSTLLEIAARLGVSIKEELGER